MTKIKPSSGETVFPENLEYFMREFQRTREPWYWHKVLARVNKLMMKMIWQERKRYKELEEVENQDLYQIAVIALYDALLKFDFKKGSLHYFPRYLQGYIRNGIKVVIREQRRYVPCGISAALFEDYKQSCETARVQKEWIIKRFIVAQVVEGMIKQGKLKREHWDMFVMRYEMDMTYKEIAEKARKSKTWIIHVVVRTEKQLRKKFASQ
jgi:RNA polymerase sigma factor (sigma-70 family)